jgi:hypothetical protein
MKTFRYFITISDFFIEWEMFQIKVVNNVEKYGGARKAADNMAPACGTLGK